MLEAGRFPAEAAVSAIIEPKQAAETLPQWSENPARFAKVMVRFNPV